MNINASRTANVTVVAGFIAAAATLVCAQSPPPVGERIRLVPQDAAMRAPGFPPVP